MKPILLIGGSDPSGGAGVQADIVTAASLGLRGWSVLTAAVAQNTQGVAAVHPLPPEVVAAQLHAVLEDCEPAAVKCGMLYSPETVRVVAGAVRDRPHIVVDPVLRATAGGSLSADGLADAIGEHLLPLAEVVTPNWDEAGVLSGKRLETRADAERACRAIRRLGCRYVLLKGGHAPGSEACDLLFDGERFRDFGGPKAEAALHGAGCAFATLVAGNLSLGLDVVEAVACSKEAIARLIPHARKCGRGLLVLDPLRDLRRAAQAPLLMEAVRGAASELKGLLVRPLVPEVGINIAFALEGATALDEVCALEGRMLWRGGKAKAFGGTAFGASKHIGSVVLAVMRRFPESRCAVNLSFSWALIEACRKAGLKLASFDRTKEPPGVSTMEWGTASAIEKLAEPPDAIYDAGAWGKEPMVRIIGRTPGEVVEKVKRVAAFTPP